MTRMEDNQSPRLTFLESAAPGTPASTLGYLYEKTDGKLYFKNDAGTETDLSAAGSGNVATDAIWDAAGDLVQGTGANTGAKLSAGTAGMFLKSAGAAAANLWAFASGYELDYVEKTTNTSITATVEASADTIVTGAAIAYSGSQRICIEYFCSDANPTTTNGLIFTLFDGSTSLGYLGVVQVTAAPQVPVLTRRFLTPSAATHTYSIRAWMSASTGSVTAGAGGAGNFTPTYMRITVA